MKVLSYGSTLTVTREELNEARRTAPSFQGLAYLAHMKRSFELADHQEREMFAAQAAYDAAMKRYEQEMREWPKKRRAIYDREEARIARGVPFTEADKERLLQEFEMLTPEKPESLFDRLLRSGK